MRTIIALPLLALAACQVTEDDQNDAITVQYNEDVAANAAEDIGNAAQEAGEAIAKGEAILAGDVRLTLTLPAWTGLVFPSEAGEASA